MQDAIAKLQEKGNAAKSASRRLAHLSTDTKNQALLNISEGLIKRQKEIIEQNHLDLEEAKASGMSTPMLDRLLLNQSRIESIAQDIGTVASFPDPVGETFDMKTLPNGLQIGKRRVPLGVIGAIYESRPNVTVDISSLCLKSGNAIILRGGKEAIRSNMALVGVIRDAISEAGVPGGAVQFVDSPERELVNYMLKMRDTIDLLIPRGGPGLINMVRENAMMPVITGGVGVCHTYVDRTADLSKAVAIVYNAKVQRPTVCNALDTVLVHRDVAEGFLPILAQEWARASVEMHCDERAMAILKAIPSISFVPASSEDWGKEFLALVAAVKVVDSLDEAIEHIERYGSGHSEAIITEDYSSAMRFLDMVDAACVYVNASTRFTDGGQFGLGAEVGISTQKLHARGPMGLKELTTYKWIIFGSGQVRS